jgi:hypothetical protein
LKFENKSSGADLFAGRCLSRGSPFRVRLENNEAFQNGCERQVLLSRELRTLENSEMSEEEGHDA